MCYCLQGAAKVTVPLRATSHVVVYADTNDVQAPSIQIRMVMLGRAPMLYRTHLPWPEIFSPFRKQATVMKYNM
jgi:hypothetical protein